MLFLCGIVIGAGTLGVLWSASSKPVAAVSFAEPAALPPAPAVVPAAANQDLVLPDLEESELFTLMMSSKPDAHSSTYQIAKGDTLTGIAKKYGTTKELIQEINKINPDKIIPGKKLKVPTFKFSVIVDKSLNRLILKGDELALKTYIVSTGTNNSTPVGTFKITDKIVNPTWYTASTAVAPGSPENVLGTRWMGFTLKSYGIHGTTEPDKLGQQVTAGCVRMKNSDVEELYKIIPPGTEVTIID